MWDPNLMPHWGVRRAEPQRKVVWLLKGPGLQAANQGFLKKNKLYFFIILAVLGVCGWAPAFPSCGAQAFLIAAHRLSWSSACGIFAGQGLNP